MFEINNCNERISNCVLTSGISLPYEKIAFERSREEQHSHLVSFSNEKKTSICDSSDSLSPRTSGFDYRSLTFSSSSCCLLFSSTAALRSSSFCLCSSSRFHRSSTVFSYCSCARLSFSFIACSRAAEKEKLLTSFWLVMKKRYQTQSSSSSLLTACDRLLISHRKHSCVNLSYFQLLVYVNMR